MRLWVGLSAGMAAASQLLVAEGSFYLVFNGRGWGDAISFRQGHESGPGSILPADQHSIAFLFWL